MSIRNNIGHNLTLSITHIYKISELAGAVGILPLP
jgi:hypothetical protein